MEITHEEPYFCEVFGPVFSKRLHLNSHMLSVEKPDSYKHFQGDPILKDNFALDSNFMQMYTDEKICFCEMWSWTFFKVFLFLKIC